ncbi:hypothetical protein HB364_17730 [Pseudoflavitalea sp. X16]|uniref:hypothetical protein n=1 Tax=Paraflavitalea devenefica TaxID=2716334 RepID=UPI00142308EE|nr:hypothetical protein [Paraflavitalea devenefica]NII26935.1 hypothetical protein [Paraflavitalea devenefica]
MAKIIAPYQIKGSTGDTTYYVNEFGQQMKLKGGPTAWQVKHLDSMANTRRNAAEWKRATAASQLMRRALVSLLPSVKNIRLNSRMNGPMLAALKADPIHDWGERVIAAGDLSVLSGFEFNHKLLLDDALPLNIENTYSIEAGKVMINIPAFRLRRKKAIPAEATHYRLVSCVLTIDFEKRSYTCDQQAGSIQAMGRKAGEAFCLEQVVQPANEQGCFWLMGIEFYKLVNDKPKLVRGGALRIMQWIGETNSREVGKPEVGEVDEPAHVECFQEEATTKLPVEAVDIAKASPIEFALEEVGPPKGEAPAELAMEADSVALVSPADGFEKSLRILPPVKNEHRRLSRMLTAILIKSIVFIVSLAKVLIL